jgi:hypothetical protein
MFSSHRILLLFPIGFALLPLLALGEDKEPDKLKTEHFTGKVVRTDKASPNLALSTNDGKALPLIKDGGSRMFFADPALLNRPMRLTAARVDDSLRVMAVRSLRNGKLHDVYYWCDICAIRRNEKMICECCGGPMELTEEPVEK